MNASQLLEVAMEVSAETKTPDGRWAGSGQSAQVPDGRPGGGQRRRRPEEPARPERRLGRDQCARCHRKGHWKK